MELAEKVDSVQTSNLSLNSNIDVYPITKYKNVSGFEAFIHANPPLKILAHHHYDYIDASIGTGFALIGFYVLYLMTRNARKELRDLHRFVSPPYKNRRE